MRHQPDFSRRGESALQRNSRGRGSNDTGEGEAMSADNEIAVLLCIDQCRVAECSTWHIWGLDPDMPNPNPTQRRLLRETFANAQPLPTEQAAMEEAQRQYDDAEYVEYGIHVYRTDLAWSELYAVQPTYLTH